VRAVIAFATVISAARATPAWAADVRTIAGNGNLGRRRPGDGRLDRDVPGNGGRPHGQLVFHRVRVLHRAQGGHRHRRHRPGGGLRPGWRLRFGGRWRDALAARLDSPRGVATASTGSPGRLRRSSRSQERASRAARRLASWPSPPDAGRKRSRVSRGRTSTSSAAPWRSGARSRGGR
jgi:hypothetical protein